MESATLLCSEGFGLPVPMYFHNENGSKGPIGKGAHEPKAPGVQASPIEFSLRQGPLFLFVSLHPGVSMDIGDIIMIPLG